MELSIFLLGKNKINIVVINNDKKLIVLWINRKHNIVNAVNFIVSLKDLAYYWSFESRTCIIN